jgi:hypothetical protein
VINCLMYSSDSLNPVLTNGDEAQGNLPNLGDIDSNETKWADSACQIIHQGRINVTQMISLTSRSSVESLMCAPPRPQSRHQSG